MRHPEVVRVIYLVSTLRRTGPTSQLLNIVRNLDRSRFAPIVVTLSKEEKSSMKEAFVQAGIPVASFGQSRFGGLVTRYWAKRLKLLGAGEEGRRFVIHSQGIRADRIAAFKLRDYPRLATARMCPPVDYRLKYGSVIGGFAARSHLSAFRRLPVVVACSGALQSDLLACGVQTRLIRNGVDTEKFSRVSQEERLSLRLKAGLEGNAKVAVCVGALSARKNPLTVIKAALAVRDERLRVVFVGDGPLRRSCEGIAVGDSRIRFVGHVEDVADWLKCADVLVSASLAEGFPNAALEALACGCRLILSSIGPHQELLDVVPGAGACFKLDRPDRLAGLLAAETAFDDAPRASEVERKVGARRMAEEYENVYAQLSSA